MVAFVVQLMRTDQYALIDSCAALSRTPTSPGQIVNMTVDHSLLLTYVQDTVHIFASAADLHQRKFFKFGEA